ncbi:hypothetical protein CBR_g46195 [Chara braunii]|uniref:cytochrome-b5 reductase n=1 Tax=Chara braunii TaxID=69332 RepID=A0A388M051_CHABU|nr:hypothetical protein CBR_g46195 [Chara braunii]|eukprot:GBG87895.1 hypothetical protein CBR_g46195 [Chara braunii]
MASHVSGDGDGGKTLVVGVAAAAAGITVAAAPNQLQVYPNGKMTQHMNNLVPGDTLDVKGPITRIPYTANMKKRIGMICGGSGITPMFQVLDRIAKTPEDTTQVSLVFANVSESDILLRKELDCLSFSHPNVKWRLWCEHFVDLSVCLVRVRLTWTRDEEHRAWFEYLELLIIQVWRTNMEGDLLGFLFGSVRPGHRQLIVQELTIPLAQLVDDFPLEIVSQSDESPVPHVLTRTLTPCLQWSACLEEPGSGRNPPSQRGYLDPRKIIDLAFFQDRTVSKDEELAIAEKEEEEEGVEEEEAAEENDEEETPEEGSYSEHNEGEQSEAEEEEEEEELEHEESEWEISVEEAEQMDDQAKDPDGARERRSRSESDSWNSPASKFADRRRSGPRSGAAQPRRWRPSSRDFERTDETATKPIPLPLDLRPSISSSPY